MLEKINKIKEQQKRLTRTSIYFSMTTARDLVLGKDPTALFVATFGDFVPVKGAIHKHYSTPLKTPFVLDSLLVSAKDLSIKDDYGAVKDISERTINTTEACKDLLDRKPFLAIRAASLIAETGFSPSEELLRVSEVVAPRLKYIDGVFIWSELCRLLRAEKPSIGIEYLRQTGILQVILPELQACFGVGQNPRYHKNDVYTHLVLSCDMCLDNDIRLRFAALIHDIGKVKTKGIGKNGITFHKHEVIGTSLAKNIVKRLRLHRNDAEFILGLVSNHMYQYTREWKDSTVLAFIQNVGLTKDYIGNFSNFPLFKLRQAERLGRGLEPVTQKQRDFEHRIEALLKNSM